MDLKCAGISVWGKGDQQKPTTFEFNLSSSWNRAFKSPPKLSISSGDSWTKTTSLQTISSLLTLKWKPTPDSKLLFWHEVEELREPFRNSTSRIKNSYALFTTMLTHEGSFPILNQNGLLVTNTNCFPLQLVKPKSEFLWNNSLTQNEGRSLYL